MKAVLAFVSLALLSTSLADDLHYEKVMQCMYLFWDVAFGEPKGNPISEKDKCFSLCLMGAEGMYHDGIFNMDKIRADAVERAGVELKAEEMKRISEIKGKNNCDTAYQILQYINGVKKGAPV